LAVLAPLAVALATIVAPAQAAPIRKCHLTVIVGNDVAAMQASVVGVRGQTCGRGRAVVRAFLTTVRDDAGCLHDAQFAPGGCEWRDHLCFRSNLGMPRSNRCIAQGTAVYWRERDGAVI
jgi:hypothetical protein